MKLTKTGITYVDLDKLSPSEQMTLQRFSETQRSKAERMLKKPTSLKIAIELHNIAGKRKKYSIKVYTVYAGKMFMSHGFDFTFSTAMRKAFNAIEAEVKKATKTDERKPGRDARRKNRYSEE